MLTIKATAQTHASPEQVLEAGTDFSEWRAKAWLNVQAKRLEVHDRGDAFVEATEGTLGPFGLFWERCRYDWSQPGVVKATVLDSNIFEPRTTWELRAAPYNGGTRAEMIVHREFRNGPKARFASAINHAAGRQVLGMFLRHAIRAVEKRHPAD